MRSQAGVALTGPLLREEAADRKSESLDLPNAERIDEGGGVLRHFFNSNSEPHL
jgi:hypothetical protein